MGILDGLLKGVASAGIAGTAAYYATGAATAGIRISSTTMAAIGGFLWYARVWIQGTLVDRWYSPEADLRGRTAVITGGTAGQSVHSLFTHYWVLLIRRAWIFRS